MSNQTKIPSALVGGGGARRRREGWGATTPFMTSRARAMRHEPTEAEKQLWKLLRNRQLVGLKFRRQFVIGNYIADFACMERRLIVEADGGQYAESSHDDRRDAWFQQQGFNVLRFWNTDILSNPNGVLETILQHLAATSPSSGSHLRCDPPSPARGEGFEQDIS